jgi:uncharacterized protein YhaN
MSATSTEIVKATLDQGLSLYRSEAQAIVVSDQAGYIKACQLALDVRSYMKDVKAKLGPGIDSAKAHLDRLRNDMNAYLAPAKEIDDLVSGKAESWKRAEREAAERERQRIQMEEQAKARAKAEEERRQAEAAAAEARKAREKELEAQRKAGELKAKEVERLKKIAAEEEAKARELAAKQAAETAAAVPEVHVAPAVPKVAGIKARVNWKFRIVDASKLPRTYLMADEVRIGQFVRETKKAGEVIPGVEAYSEDGI